MNMVDEKRTVVTITDDSSIVIEESRGTSSADSTKQLETKEEI